MHSSKKCSCPFCCVYKRKCQDSCEFLFYLLLLSSLAKKVINVNWLNWLKVFDSCCTQFKHALLKLGKRWKFAKIGDLTSNMITSEINLSLNVFFSLPCKHYIFNSQCTAFFTSPIELHQRKVLI